MDLDDGFEPLFASPVHGGSMEEAHIGEDDVDEEGERASEGFDYGRNKKKSVKRVLVREAKKTRRKSALLGGEGKPKVSVVESRRIEKEWKAHIDEIHAESQRLLRETRGVSFKSVPFVQTPISSVLDKIRARKLEALKRCGVSEPIHSSADGVSTSIDAAHGIDFTVLNCGDGMINSEMQEVNDGHLQEVNKQKGPFCHIENSYNEGFKDKQEEALQEPPSAMKDALDNSQSGFFENERLDYNDTAMPEDGPLLSLQKENFSETDSLDSSSSSEYNDKENVDLYPGKVISHSSHTEAGLVKSFLDIEAEEEDDSDQDLARLEENEEDDIGDDSEELADVVVHGYKEAPIDHERRNQLHQKWLEQQDATATENILHRLNCGANSRESMLQADEDGLDSDGDAQDGAADNQVPAAAIQKNPRKLKEMMMQMFIENNNDYINSDDEETEQKLKRQRLLKVEEPTFVSPLEDESSREFFSLIRKPSVTVDPKKPKSGKTSLDMLVKGGNNNSSSKKSSFLGRASSGSLPSCGHKQGANTFRTFIYGRDDSNSRNSSISASDNTSSSEDQQREGGPKHMAPGRGTAPPPPVVASKSRTGREGNASSEPSLFNILRSSSIACEQKRAAASHEHTTEALSSYQFSAFKLERRFSRLDKRN